MKFVTVTLTTMLTFFRAGAARPWQRHSAAFTVVSNSTPSKISPRHRTSGFGPLSPRVWNTPIASGVHPKRKDLFCLHGGAVPSSSTSSLNSAATTAAATEEVGSVEEPKEVFRTDYRSLPLIVSEINMDFDIFDGRTVVTTDMTVQRNPKAMDEDKILVLDGDESSVSLQSVTMNGVALTEGTDYILAPGKMTILPEAFASHADNDDAIVLSTVVEIVPETNTQLSGLYKSGPMYCSQCEAEGFRRITYYPDRPDNMAVFQKVRITADKSKYPVLLCNGNRLEGGDSDDGRHYAVWSDPYPKPSYLFCLVAGDLQSIKDTFRTASGRDVHLEIYSEAENVGKLSWAMESLKSSMVWDEKTFGLEYDLDLYNIVAVNDFNMGAMENKGLNVFNTALCLADPKTATDADYARVEGVIGHEYFHNWTGNRVTCRDWFQLTLKEGLTVFRDQEFSGDMNSKAVQRISDVRSLRGAQFNEDAGPMAHPIRPQSYISMDNFYTATVYSKGAEVIRMYNTILGTAGFRKGMDLYFERHDGDAVTCEDFLNAMADANDVDLSVFARWYATPGTPTITYSTSHDTSTNTYTLTLSQQSLSEDGPLHIPVSVGLLDKSTGEEILPTTVLNLKEDTQDFSFPVPEGAVIIPSMLRQFSAPVKLTPEQSPEELAILAAYDTDGFNRWEAGQKLYTSAIFATMAVKLPDLSDVHEVFDRALAGGEDYQLRAYALALPGESTLSEDVDVVDPIAIRKARGAVKKALARQHQSALKELYEDLTSAMEGLDFSVDSVSVGRRSLRNAALEYLCALRETEEEQLVAAELASKHYMSATCMTDKMAALNALASMDGAGAAARDEALKAFYKDADGDALVLNKWFSVQALAHLPDVLDRVRALTEHPDFTLNNPNRARSLISAFAMNAAPFHDESGEGYKFMGEMVAALDKLNPQISSRTARSLIQWRRYSETRGNLMKAELEKLKGMEGISPDLFEIVSRGLK